MDGAPNICSLFTVEDLEAMMELSSSCDGTEPTGTFSMDTTQSYEVDGYGGVTSTPYTPTIDVNGSPVTVVFQDPVAANQECLTLSGLAISSLQTLIFAKKFTSNTNIEAFLKIELNLCHWSFTPTPYS